MASNHFNLRLLLKIMAAVVVLGLLWIICIGRPERKWESAYILTDGVEESECNCSKVMLGDVDELRKAKLLTLRKDFRQKSRVPDDFYIGATQDCKCVAELVSFVVPFLKLLTYIHLSQNYPNLFSCFLNIMYLQ